MRFKLRSLFILMTLLAIPLAFVRVTTDGSFTDTAVIAYAHNRGKGYSIGIGRLRRTGEIAVSIHQFAEYRGCGVGRCVWSTSNLDDGWVSPRFLDDSGFPEPPDSLKL